MGVGKRGQDNVWTPYFDQIYLSETIIYLILKFIFDLELTAILIFFNKNKKGNIPQLVQIV